MADMVAFINENIWEINQFPRIGYRYDYYTLNDIFFYNSLEDTTFEHQNKTACVQIPESKILGLGSKFNIPYNEKKCSVKDFVLENKNIIIKNKLPIIRRIYENETENWYCDLNMIFFDPKRDWRNVSL
jgi:hypothetical protein